MPSSATMELHLNVGFQSDKNMEQLYISTTLKITKGKAQLAFPDALKRDALYSSLQCMSLSFETNSRAANETCFLIASLSPQQQSKAIYIRLSNILNILKGDAKKITLTFLSVATFTSRFLYFCLTWQNIHTLHFPMSYCRFL